MKRLILSLLVGVGVLLPSTSSTHTLVDGIAVADGSACDPDMYGKISVGKVKTTWCVVLCHADAANVNCSEFDLDSVGQPDLVVFELVETGSEDCSAVTVTINSSGESGINAADTNAFDIGSTTALAIGGVRKITVDVTRAPLDRYIYVTTTNTTCGSDEYDVIMYGLEVSR